MSITLRKCNSTDNDMYYLLISWQALKKKKTYQTVLKRVETNKVLSYTAIESINWKNFHKKMYYLFISR